VCFEYFGARHPKKIPYVVKDGEKRESMEKYDKKS
jgi:hypothetical protein